MWDVANGLILPNGGFSMGRVHYQCGCHVYFSCMKVLIKLRTKSATDNFIVANYTVLKRVGRVHLVSLCVYHLFTSCNCSTEREIRLVDIPKIWEATLKFR